MNHLRQNDYQELLHDEVDIIQYNTDELISKNHQYSKFCLEEKQLFCLIAQNNEIAFRQLFNIYSPLFTAIIKKIVKDNAVIEDLLQDVFLKIWLKRELLNQIDNPRSWALQIVYHISFNRLRSLKIASKIDNYNNLVKAEEIANSVEDTLYHSETSALIQNAIRQLPPQTRKIYILNREEGIKIIDIAKRLHISTQTVKNTLGKATREIKTYLIRQGITRL